MTIDALNAELAKFGENETTAEALIDRVFAVTNAESPSDLSADDVRRLALIAFVLLRHAYDPERWSDG